MTETNVSDEQKKINEIKAEEKQRETNVECSQKQWCHRLWHHWFGGAAEEEARPKSQDGKVVHHRQGKTVPPQPVSGLFRAGTLSPADTMSADLSMISLI
jgi:hypothetical protein